MKLVLSAIAILSLAACDRQPPAPLPQRAYVWQRQWTPAVKAAAQQGADKLDGLVVFAAAVTWEEGQPKHYLYTAAAHGWSAAQLLPDQSDELADVLNTCGRWIQNDAPAADKFFQAIERRAWKTEIGRAAGARHWFVTQTGPWSAEGEP